MLVRHADAARDAVACAAVYAPFVTNGTASFETQAPSAPQMGERIAQTSRDWPWLVVELDGRVAGYAYASSHRARAAYRWSVEVSVYVDGALHRRGLGRALYEPLLALLRAQGCRQACAGIALPNPASVALHEALGFTAVGVYRDIGFKLGRWWDVGWWQRALGEDDGLPPSPLRPPRTLDGIRVDE